MRSMRLSISSRFTVFLLELLLLPGCVWAQSQKDPLNDEEIDQIREYADRPVDRIKLYMKFIEQRVAAIKQLASDSKAQNKAAKLRNLMEEFTRLCDELQDNLEGYDDNHSDVRKALKDLAPASTTWADVLNVPAPEPSYDFARKTALEAASSTADEIHKLQEDQEKYFATHKPDKDPVNSPNTPKSEQK
jgi:hypothetical protein